MYCNASDLYGNCDGERHDVTEEAQGSVERMGAGASTNPQAAQALNAIASKPADCSDIVELQQARQEIAMMRQQAQYWNNQQVTDHVTTPTL